MSKTTMTILAAVGAVAAVLVLGLVIGFAVDSDDVDVADAATLQESGTDDGDPAGDDNGGVDSDGQDESDADPSGEIDDVGDLLSCLTDAGVGLDDLSEFDVDIGQLLEECLGGLLGGDFADGFDGEDFNPFGLLEEFFADGGDGGLGGFEEFFEQFEDTDGFNFDEQEFEDFFNDLFGDTADEGA